MTYSNCRLIFIVSYLNFYVITFDILDFMFLFLVTPFYSSWSHWTLCYSSPVCIYIDPTVDLSLFYPVSNFFITDFTKGKINFLDGSLNSSSRFWFFLLMFLLVWILVVSIWLFLISICLFQNRHSRFSIYVPLLLLLPSGNKLLLSTVFCCRSFKNPPFRTVES